MKVIISGWGSALENSWPADRLKEEVDQWVETVELAETQEFTKLYPNSIGKLYVGIYPEKSSWLEN